MSFLERVSIIASCCCLVACGQIPLGTLPPVGEGGGGNGGESDGGGGSGEPADGGPRGGAAGLPIENGGAPGMRMGPGGSGAIDDAGPPLEGTPPSCRAGLVCGADAVSCCESLRVPAGEFILGLQDPAANTASQAQLSEFYLDRFEVTVGRFREFVAAYDEWLGSGNPVVGAGPHAAIAGAGWQEAWSSALPVNSALLEQGLLQCDNASRSTWAPGTPEATPMNCVSWYEAFAFCAWDGGRLPTLAEWEYAATGGDERRPYPWGLEPAPSTALALFGCELFEDDPASCPLSALSPVGSHALGAGRWGQEDLAGSISEWVLDALGAYPPECTDCVVLPGTGDAPVSVRMLRGGSWLQPADELGIAQREPFLPELRGALLGFRCARNP